MSAGSHTEPGGYASPSDAEPQFQISDDRSPRAVADRVGRRKTLIWGAILFIVGSVIAPLSPNVVVLFIARALLGIAVGEFAQ